MTMSGQRRCSVVAEQGLGGGRGVAGPVGPVVPGVGSGRPAGGGGVAPSARSSDGAANRQMTGMAKISAPTRTAAPMRRRSCACTENTMSRSLVPVSKGSINNR